MNGVDDVHGIGKEGFFNFVRRGDPVAGTDDHRWGVQFIEGQLGDLGGHGVQVAAPLAGVGGEQDLAGLFN